MEKKAKVSICKKCGYGIPVRAESCRRCSTPAEKKEEVKLQIKKINITQKSAPVQKPKLVSKKPASASPSEARTKNLGLKATRRKSRRKKT